MLVIIFISTDFFRNYPETRRKLRIIEYTKEKINELRAIDKILYYIIDPEDKLSRDDFIIQYYQNDFKIKNTLNIGKYIWQIDEEDYLILKKNRPIFYITERIVYIPFVKVHKMVKGLVEERGIKLEIKKDFFNQNENNEYENYEEQIKIKVLSPDDDKYYILLNESNGKLLMIPFL